MTSWPPPPRRKTSARLATCYRKGRRAFHLDEPRESPYVGSAWGCEAWWFLGWDEAAAGEPDRFDTDYWELLDILRRGL